MTAFSANEIPAYFCGGFGVNLHPDDIGLDEQSASVTLERARELGFRFLRTDFPWSELEPAPGKWDEKRFEWFKWYVEFAAKHGLQVQVVVGSPPEWARNLYFENPASFFWEFYEYSREIAKRFGRYVYFYQVWNEADSPRDFVLPWDDWKLFRAGSAGIRSQDSSSEIIVNFISSIPWWELKLNYWMLAAGRSIDIIGIDHYPGTWYFGNYDDWSPLERLCAKTQTQADPCFGKRIAIQETGFSTFLPIFHGENDQKRWIERSLPSLKNVINRYNLTSPRKFVSVCFYELYDAGFKPGFWVEDYFGIVKKNGVEKSGYQSLKNCVHSFGKDTDPPGGSVVLNGGAAETRSRRVRVTISVEDFSGVSEMCLANEKPPGEEQAIWQPYRQNVRWKLRRGAGKKTVYVRLKDPWGNVSQPLSATIYLVR